MNKPPSFQLYWSTSAHRMEWVCSCRCMAPRMSVQQSLILRCVIFWLYVQPYWTTSHCALPISITQVVLQPGRPAHHSSTYYHHTVHTCSGIRSSCGTWNSSMLLNLSRLKRWKQIPARQRPALWKRNTFYTFFRWLKFRLPTRGKTNINSNSSFKHYITHKYISSGLCILDQISLGAGSMREERI